jgi:long-subunit acyl-CoA synthetase (AMP-forming)
VPKRKTIPTVKDAVAWENDFVLASFFDTRATETEPSVAADYNPGDEFFTGGTTGTPKGAMLALRNSFFYWFVTPIYKNRRAKKLRFLNHMNSTIKAKSPSVGIQ